MLQLALGVYCAAPLNFALEAREGKRERRIEREKEREGERGNHESHGHARLLCTQPVGHGLRRKPAEDSKK